MKVMFVIGSPRKKGNTSSIAAILNSELKKSNIETEIINVYDYDIKACIDCRYCKSGELKCKVKDDATPLYEKIKNVDAIVFGTPIYWSGPSAKLKLFIDRLRPFYANKQLNGKKAAVLLAAYDGAADCDLTTEMFKRIFKSLGIIYLSTIAVKAYDIGDVTDNTSINTLIQNLLFKIYSN